MNRDGHTTSIWQEALSDLNSAKTATINPQYDVIIVGAGITGLSLGLALQEAGKRCLIMEARNIGFGTSSGTTAHLNTVLDTPYTTIISKFGLENAKLVAKGAAEAIDTIFANINRYNFQCNFEWKSGFLFAENDEQEKTLQEIYEALTKVDIEATYSDKLPAPVPFTKAITFPWQAQFHPVHYLQGLVAAFREEGGHLIEQCLVDDLKEQADYLEVYNGDRHYTAEYVIYATHLPPGINILDFRCAPYRTYVLGVELEDDNAYPDALVDDLQQPFHYFRTAYVEGRKILLVGGNDHKTGHNENTGHEFTVLEAYIRKFYKIKSIPFKWSAQYYEPADGLPYIGHLPGAPEKVFVATGYGGNGMIFGTLASRIITDLILEDDNPYTALFSPARMKPVAAFKKFLTENADVVKHFVADRLSVEELSAFADLSKGEGRIVKYEKRQLAVYKDEQGAIKALHPVCPHVGCIVQWNGAEKSWDCPCHGARYDTDGNLLTGPATTGLKEIPFDGDGI